MFLSIFILPLSLFAEVISTINKSGEDYNTLTLWEDAVDGTLSEVQTAEVYADDGALDDRVTINGSVTAVDKYMNLTVAAEDRHVGVWDDSKMRIVPTSAGTILSNQDPWTRVTWFQILLYAGDSTGYYAGSSSGTLSHCIIDGSNDVLASAIYSVGSYNKFYRNIIYDHNEPFFAAVRIAGGDYNKFYNNTIYNSYMGFRTSNATDLIINNAIFSSLANGDFYDTNGDASSDYNCISEMTHPGTPAANNLYGQGAGQCVVSTVDGSQDFRLKNILSPTYQAGTDLGSPYDIDVDGSSITGSWSIGASQSYQESLPARTNYTADVDCLFALIMEADESPIEDMSVNGLDGVLSGAGEPNWATATPDPVSYSSGYFEWDNSNDRVDVSTAIAIAKRDFSAVLWHYGTMDGYDTMLYFDDNFRIARHGSGHGIAVIIAGTSGTIIRVDSPGVFGAWWTHVAITWDDSASTLLVYVNGGIKVMSSSSGYDSAGQVDDIIYLGRRGTLSAMAGSLDEVAVFKRILTVDEIVDIGQQGLYYSAPPAAPTSGVVPQIW